MHFDSLASLIFGKVTFRASDGFSHLFINECYKEKIILHNLKNNDNFVSGWIYNTDVGRLFNVGEKSGMRIEITERKGLSHLAFRYRKRLGIPLGLLLFGMILLTLNSMIWTVEIDGNDTVSDAQIVQLLSENGIKKGAFSSTLNGRDAEFSLYKAFSDISWVNVKFIGSRAFITIRERNNKEEYKENIYSNIIASKDGEIERAEVFSGDANLYKGTAVVKGDLLVSGIRNNRDGSVSFLDSEAKIFARTKNYISSPVHEVIKAKKQNICKEKYLLSFYGIEIPLNKGVNADAFTENQYFFNSSDVVFPIGIVRQHQYSFEEKEFALSTSQALTISMRDFAISAMKLYENAEILERDISCNFGNEVEICGRFLCIEDIALKKEFTVDEENQHPR